MLNNKKNNKYKKIVLSGLILVFCGGLLIASPVLADSCAEGKIALQVSVPGIGKCVSDFPEYITTFYKFFISIVGILAVIMIMAGGFQWLMAAGNAQKITGAKTIIISAIMGLVLTFTSYTILNVLNPAVLDLKLKVDPVKLYEPEADTYCKAIYQATSEGKIEDRPECGKKYMYDKNLGEGAIEIAYCKGFFCKSGLACLTFEGIDSCQKLITIKDTKSGYEERKWLGNTPFFWYPCGDLISGNNNFRFGTLCGSENKENCYINALEGVDFSVKFSDVGDEWITVGNFTTRTCKIF